MSVTNLHSAGDELLALSQAVSDLSNKLARLTELDAILRQIIAIRHVPRVPTTKPARALPAPAQEPQR